MSSPVAQLEQTPCLVIRASAGSGKTHALTTRFLALLLRGEDPTRILASTFTVKAAAEIAERIMVRLCDAVLGQENLTTLSKQCNLPNLTADAVQRALLRMLEPASQSALCTLDSLFVRFAQGFSTELGLGFNWTISDYADEPGQSDVRLARSVMEDPAAANDLVRRLADRPWPLAITSQLERSLAKFASLHRRYAKAFVYRPGITVDPEKRLALIESLTTLKLPMTKQGKPDQRFATALSNLRRWAESNDYESFLKASLPYAAYTGGNFYNIAVTAEQFAPLIAVTQYLCDSYRVQLEQESLRLANFLAICERQYAADRRHHGRYNHDDIKWFVSSLAQGVDADILAYRLDQSFRHVLLDEFQDTSPEQWNFLQPLVEEIVAQANVERTFLCVGDAKQSIYGFRGSRPELFDELTDHFPSLKTHDLDVSYRSSPAVIDTVNAVFGALSTHPTLAQYPEVAKQWSSRFSAHSTMRKESEGKVTFELTDPEIDPIVCVADRVAEQLQLIPESSIAILVRRNETAAALYGMLTERKVTSISVEGGSSTAQSSLTYAVTALLKIIEHPDDAISAYIVQNSCFGSLADKLSVLQKEVFEHGIVNCLLAHRADLKLAAADNSELDEILEALSPLNKPGTLVMAQVLQALETRRGSARTLAQVRILTVHAAKGLEFDTVYLCELDRRLIDSARDALVVHTKDGPMVVPRITQDVARYDSVLSEALATRNKRALSEELSLLYVAMTRARHQLHMVGAAAEKMSFTATSLLVDALAPGQYGVIGTVYSSHHVPAIKGIPRQRQHSKKPAPVLMPSKYIPPARLLPTVPSAKLEEGRPIAPVASRAGLLRGVMRHRLLEQIEWWEQDIPWSKFQSLLEAEFGERELSQKICQETLELFAAQGEFAAVFQRTPNTIVLRERRFAVRDDRELILGSIDRLTINKTTGEVRLYDFKSSFGEMSEERRQQVIHQLTVYRRAAALHLHVAPSSIRCIVLELPNGKVWEAL